jgi:ketosteroid isomerase-like protein
MSKAVKTVRALIGALSNGEYDRAATYLHPEAEWHNTAVFPGPRVVTGAQAIRDFWEDLFEAYAATSRSSGMEVERAAESGETVVVLMHGWGHGAESGIPFDTRWAHACVVRESRVLRVDTYGRYETALQAAGLPDQANRRN